MHCYDGLFDQRNIHQMHHLMLRIPSKVVTVGCSSSERPSSPGHVVRGQVRQTRLNRLTHSRWDDRPSKTHCHIADSLRHVLQIIASRLDVLSMRQLSSRSPLIYRYVFKPSTSKVFANMQGSILSAFYGNSLCMDDALAHRISLLKALCKAKKVHDLAT